MSSPARQPPSGDAPDAARRQRVTRLESLFAQACRAPINTAPLLKLMRCHLDDAEEVIAAVESCPTLTGRLIGVINSAAFGLPRPIESVRRAVLQFGARRARTLALAYAMRAIQEASSMPADLAQHLWVNSLRKACAAKLACEAMGDPASDEVFCLALVQDIGLAALHEIDPSFYRDRLSAAAHGTWCEQEIAHFAMDHAEAGARLLEIWGAPSTLHELIAAHHRPPRSQVEAASAARVGLFLSSLIPHFGEPAGAYEREWMQMIHAQLLHTRYPTLEQFLDAADQQARRIHCGQIPPPPDAQIVGELARLVCEDTHALVGQLCLLEESLDLARKQTHALRFEARTDPLTCLLNRRGFFDLGERRVALAAERAKPVMLLAVDVDNFKRVNDTYGHDGGDRLLCALARMLRENLASEDLIGRIGGDEFVVLSIGPDDNLARSVVERIHQRCNGAALRIDEQREATLCFSLGVVHSPRVEPGVGLDQLMQRADEAMYRRKREGKAGYVFVNYPHDAAGQPRPAA